MKTMATISLVVASSLASATGTTIMQGGFLFERHVGAAFPGGIAWLENTSNGIAVRAQTHDTGVAIEAISDPGGLSLSAQGRVQIADGSEGLGRILVSDATGVARWRTPPAPQRLPAGSIVAYGGTATPTGWIICDGSAVSRSQFPGLFANIGTAFGAGDGATTFNVPDLRGRFLRGVDGGVGRDPDAPSRVAMSTGGNTGDNVGSVQLDALQGHFYEFEGNRITYSGG